MARLTPTGQSSVKFLENWLEFSTEVHDLVVQRFLIGKKNKIQSNRATNLASIHFL